MCKDNVKAVVDVASGSALKKYTNSNFKTFKLESYMRL